MEINLEGFIFLIVHEYFDVHVLLWRKIKQRKTVYHFHLIIWRTFLAEFLFRGISLQLVIQFMSLFFRALE